MTQPPSRRRRQIRRLRSHRAHRRRLNGHGRRRRRRRIRWLRSRRTPHQRRRRIRRLRYLCVRRCPRDRRSHRQHRHRTAVADERDQGPHRVLPRAFLNIREAQLLVSALLARRRRPRRVVLGLGGRVRLPCELADRVLLASLVPVRAATSIRRRITVCRRLREAHLGSELPRSAAGRPDHRFDVLDRCASARARLDLRADLANCGHVLLQPHAARDPHGSRRASWCSRSRRRRRICRLLLKKHRRRARRCQRNGRARRRRRRRIFRLGSRRACRHHRNKCSRRQRQ